MLGEHVQRSAQQVGAGLAPVSCDRFDLEFVVGSQVVPFHEPPQPIAANREKGPGHDLHQIPDASARRRQNPGSEQTTTSPTPRMSTVTAAGSGSW